MDTLHNRSRLPALVLATLACAATAPAFAQSSPIEGERMRPGGTILSPSTRICLKPYSYSAPARIPPGYSGSDAEFRFTGARYLRVDSVEARLDGATISAADLGGWTDGDFSWTQMPAENGVARYSARRDGSLYFDSNKFGKVILYHWDGSAGYTGSIKVTGCLVDKIPASSIRLPEIKGVPRLPPRRLLPGDALKPIANPPPVIRRPQGH